MSIIGTTPPSTVHVEGGDIPINTSHHCGIRVASLIDDPTIDPVVTENLILQNYFGPSISQSREALLNAALSFFARNDGTPENRNGKKSRNKKPPTRAFDWELDSEGLIADFQRFYGLDITDPSLHLHWWRFMALFYGLPSDTSATMRAISIRSRSLSDCKSKEEREALIKQKKALALPPRTAAEVTLEL